MTNERFNILSLLILIAKALAGLVLGVIVLILGLLGTCLVIVTGLGQLGQSSIGALGVAAIAFVFAFLIIKLLSYMFISPPQKINGSPKASAEKEEPYG